MPAADYRPDEPERLRALRSHRILDTPPDPAFDDLTRQAKELCDTPIALVSLVDEKRQWFKSHLGIEATETPREQSFCAHGLLSPERPLIVPDATVDPRFADNPLVTGAPGIRFYAGMILRSPEGFPLGTLCVIDQKPRVLTDRQLDKLHAIAQQVSVRLSLHRRAPSEYRLLTGFALVFLLFVGMAIYCAWQASRFLESDAWVSHTNLVISYIDRTLFGVQTAESSLRGYYASGFDSFLPAYEAAVAAVPFRIQQLRKATADNFIQQWNCGRLQAAVDVKLGVLQARFQQRRKMGADALNPKYLDNRGQVAMDGVMSVGHAMIEEENRLLRERAAARSAGLQATVTTLVLTSTTGACLILLGFLLTRRELRRKEALSGALANANAGLENEIADRRQAQRLLRVQHAVARVAAENVSLEAAANGFLQSIGEHLEWQLAEFWTLDPLAGVMRLTRHWQPAEDGSPEAARIAAFEAASQNLAFGPGQGLPGQVWSEGKTRWVENLTDEKEFMHAAAAREAGLCRAFAFPLTGSEPGDVTHVMVFFSRDARRPDADLIATMDTLAAQIDQFNKRCRAQAGLVASQSRFTAFMESTPAIAFIKDDSGRFLYGNRSLLRRFDLPADSALLGKTDEELWPEAAHALRENDRQVLAGEEVVEMKEAVPLPDGSTSHWLSYKFPLRDQVTGRKLLAGMSIDITAREQAKAALRTEREFLAAMLDNLQAGVISCDAQGRVTHCNRAAIALHGLPATGPLPPMEHWSEYFDLIADNGVEPLAPENAPLVRALLGEVSRDREFFVRPKTGPGRTLSLNVAAFTDADGRRLGAIAVMHDVTARRHAREATLQLLSEKETLLQEVHHRVKNNLQIIGSLLSMQARRTKSPAALAALNESVGRVRSIALVHEKLYGSANLERIEAADFLRSLAGNLFDALGGGRERTHGKVALRFTLEEGHELEASIAIACGLIVNEALTNSLKHSFPAQRGGIIVLALSRAADPEPLARRDGDEAGGRGQRCWLQLEIRDDGTGVPEAALTPQGMAEMARKSLGMRLIRDLSKQIGGRFKFMPTEAATGAGLTLRVTFPIALAAAAAPSPLVDRELADAVLA